jgi:phytoene dehydrogenase-like protein
MSAPPDSSQLPVLIVGAGLAGLACARALHRAGVPFQVLEAADAVGGRVRTDVVDGFLLDRGFQVFLPGYPEARRVLHYDGLDLRPIYRGADVVQASKIQRLADPLHHLKDALQGLKQDLWTWQDAWRLLLLRKETFGLRQVPQNVKAEDTEHYLRGLGFSDGFIDGFFRPFFGGIFLEKDLRSSAALFRFLFAMFDRGGAALPAGGMGAIPAQLASRLPAGSVQLGRAVKRVEPGLVTLADGEQIKGRAVVLASSEMACHEMLPEALRGNKPRARAVTCLYFAAYKKPSEEAILLLDGVGRGPVNNACVLSNVVPEYAPAGQHLISTTVLGLPSGEDLEGEVRAQLLNWFGRQVGDWRLLRTYRIHEAQPEERQLRAGQREVSLRLAPGLWRAGDYCEDASINGALLSGRKVAEELLHELS